MLLAVGIGDQDVGGLDVAVHQAARMGGVEGVGDAGHDPGRPPGRDLAALGDQVLQARALHVPHGDEEAALVVAGAVDRDDVRVLETGGDHRLAHEQLAETGVAGALGRDQLQGDLAPQLGVARAVDDAHAAPAREALDEVAGDDGPRVEDRAGGRGLRAPVLAEDRLRAHPALVHQVRPFGVVAAY